MNTNDKDATMIVITKSESETEQEGKKLAGALAPGAIIAMQGALGAGKTAFTRGLAAGLKIDAHISSPTFTIVNEYDGDIPLYHFDLYRIASSDELYDIGWYDYLERGGICAVEWSENAPGAFPDGTIYVKIENMGGDARSIEITAAPPSPSS